MPIKIIVSILLWLILATHPAVADGQKKIIVTIKPLHSLVSAVHSNDDDILLLVDRKNTPHGFRLKLSHIKAMHQADILFYIDDNLEEFLRKTIKDIAEKRLDSNS